MRSFEFNDKDLKSALMNVLSNMKCDADERDSSATISVDAVKDIMANTGYPAFNYDVFKRMYDQDKDLQNLISDFDDEKIVVKTKKDTASDPEMDFDNQGSTDKVKQMAKSAMKRRQ